MAELVPLSWIQQRMLEVPLVDDPALYVTQVVLPGAERLDPDRLRAAWQRTATRFAALRSSLVWSGDTRPAQLVGSRPEPVGEHEVRGPLTESDLRPWLDRRARLTGLFGGGKLARLDLVRRPGGPAALVFTFNHLALDGWSMSIVLDYLAGVTTEPTGVTTEPTGVTTEPAGGAIEPAGPTAALPDSADLRFWARLAGAGIAHPVRGTLRSWTDRELPEAMSGALVRCARATRVTLATLLHVVCVLALARHTGSGLPRVATALSVRGGGHRAGDNDTGAVGCLLAPLPFAVDLPAGEPVHSVLADTQALLAELHDRAASYPSFLARTGASARPEVWLGVGSFPVPGWSNAGRTPPYSVERPGAPLSLFAVPGERFRFQVVSRGELASLPPESIADALMHTCGLLAEDIARPIADFLSLPAS